MEDNKYNNYNILAIRILCLLYLLSSFIDVWFSWYWVQGSCGGLKQGGDGIGGVGIVDEVLLGGLSSLAQTHVLPAEP